jgi:hypothetical protein
MKRGFLNRRHRHEAQPGTASAASSIDPATTNTHANTTASSSPSPPSVPPSSSSSANGAFTSRSSSDACSAAHLSRDEAMARARNGATVLCLDYPPGGSLGVDAAEFRAGARFRGVKMLRPGELHLLRYDPAPSHVQTGVNTGVFMRLLPGEVRVLRWSPADEDFFDEEDATERQRLERGVRAFEMDAMLGVCTWGTRAANLWRKLTRCVSDHTLRRCGIELGAHVFPGDGPGEEEAEGQGVGGAGAAGAAGAAGGRRARGDSAATEAAQGAGQDEEEEAGSGGSGGAKTAPGSGSSTGRGGWRSSRGEELCFARFTPLDVAPPRGLAGSALSQWHLDKTQQMDALLEKRFSTRQRQRRGAGTTSTIRKRRRKQPPHPPLQNQQNPAQKQEQDCDHDTGLQQQREDEDEEQQQQQQQHHHHHQQALAAAASTSRSDVTLFLHASELELLGEFQLSFVLLHYLQLQRALEQWKRLAALLSASREAPLARPALLSEWLAVLRVQLRMVPADFFVAPLSSDSFLKPALRDLLDNCHDAMARFEYWETEREGEEEEEGGQNREVEGDPEEARVGVVGRQSVEDEEEKEDRTAKQQQAATSGRAGEGGLSVSIALPSSSSLQSSSPPRSRLPPAAVRASLRERVSKLQQLLESRFDDWRYEAPPRPSPRPTQPAEHRRTHPTSSSSSSSIAAAAAATAAARTVVSGRVGGAGFGGDHGQAVDLDLDLAAGGATGCLPSRLGGADELLAALEALGDDAPVVVLPTGAGGGGGGGSGGGGGGGRGGGGGGRVAASGRSKPRTRMEWMLPDQGEVEGEIIKALEEVDEEEEEQEDEEEEEQELQVE